ncbi:putative zinc-binding metallopeptidase [Ruegeria sp. 2205SS24-7]|uniref:zinc-binding metallopeptidase family protein n=1 Tax=Ruegeria discodermiae TaxID=3064389 RepID=UPI002742280D|nr:putative zinc-binding metallopeptidase [Ruegeria sp. 2205SS24-7]MDP5220957.1 putative zinc-binding metallopeptidase [Ruegeria sp. 2205SS24-7]
MRLYSCPKCGERVFFENLGCACGTPISYDPTADKMLAESVVCKNREVIGCNWISDTANSYCRSCAMTRTHPDMAIDELQGQWASAESSKRWVLANLGRLGWFDSSDSGARPIFDLLGEQTQLGPSDPVMGHANGIITINVAETDSVELVARRVQMGEPYRTMIGHFRHELSHFLFLRLSSNKAWLEEFRRLFGDERADYAAALERHYAALDDGSWRNEHISHYASAHPDEDWAESSAHALHLADLFDSAQHLGLVWKSEGTDLEQSLDLGIALNHLSRSMGLQDVYPFIVSPKVREKLVFARDALDRNRVWLTCYPKPEGDD